MLSLIKKKESETFLLDSLTQEDSIGLRDLGLKIRAVNFRYSNEELSPTVIKLKTKIERLQIIQKRDDDIKALIQASKYGTLYKILNLSTEYVNPILKKKIYIKVLEEITKIYTDKPNSETIFGEITYVSDRAKSRAMKIARNSVRRENVLKYIKDRVGYKLPSKA
jgi:hypothetical protein